MHKLLCKCVKLNVLFILNAKLFSKNVWTPETTYSFTEEFIKHFKKQIHADSCSMSFIMPFGLETSLLQHPLTQVLEIRCPNICFSSGPQSNGHFLSKPSRVLDKQVDSGWLLFFFLSSSCWWPIFYSFALSFPVYISQLTFAVEWAEFHFSSCLRRFEPYFLIP